MARYDELMEAICQDDADRTKFGYLVSKCVLLEEKLEYLETLPHIVVHPADPTKQKSTPAHRQYKELLQQYGNIVRILSRIHPADGDDDESPLRKWAKERAERVAGM